MQTSLDALGGRFTDMEKDVQARLLGVEGHAVSSAHGGDGATGGEGTTGTSPTGALAVIYSRLENLESKVSSGLSFTTN